MQAVLLCGGFSTRLHPLTKNTPNALLSVGGRRILDYLFDQLLTFDGLRTVHLVTNARFAAAFFRWKEEWQVRLSEAKVDVRLHVDGSIEEEDRLGEVGDLAFAFRFADPSVRTVVLSGDTIYRFPLAPVWRRFVESGEHFVLAVPETHPQVLHQRTVIIFGEDGLLTEVHHHPEEIPSNWACPPLYFLQPSALARLQAFLAASPDQDAVDAFLAFVAAAEPVRVHELPNREWRLRLNTRYMVDKANELLDNEPLMPEGWALEA